SLVLLQFTFAGGRLFDYAVDHSIRCNAFTSGREIGQQSMSKHWQCERFHVFNLHMRSAVKQCTRFSTEDEILHSARARAPLQPIADKSRHTAFTHTCLTNERQNILHDMICDWHFANNSLQVQNLLACQYGGHFLV